MHNGNEIYVIWIAYLGIKSVLLLQNHEERLWKFRNTLLTELSFKVTTICSKYTWKTDEYRFTIC